MTPDLAVVGNLLVDDVVYEDGRTRMAQPGGATLYAALGARLWGVEVAIISVVGNDYPSSVLDDLAARGIDLTGVRSLGRPGVRTWLLDEGRRRHVVHRLDGPTHAEVSPTAADLDAGPRARAVHLAPMPFDVQRGLLEALAPRRPPEGGPTQRPPEGGPTQRPPEGGPTQRPPEGGPTQHGATVSLDPYELLTDQNLGAWKLQLAGVDDFLFSEDEMLIAGGLENPRPILAALCTPLAPIRGGAARPGRIFYKRGNLGGIAYDHQARSFLEWPARAAAVVDATGAGDAFAGGVLAGRLLGDSLSRALERGVVSAAFALEGEGADGLLAASPASARQRLRDEHGWPRSSRAGGSR